MATHSIIQVYVIFVQYIRLNDRVNMTAPMCTTIKVYNIQHTRYGAAFPVCTHVFLSQITHNKMGVVTVCWYTRDVPALTIFVV